MPTQFSFHHQLSKAELDGYTRNENHPEVSLWAAFKLHISKDLRYFARGCAERDLVLPVLRGDGGERFDHARF